MVEPLPLQPALGKQLVGLQHRRRRRRGETVAGAAVEAAMVVGVVATVRAIGADLLNSLIRLRRPMWPSRNRCDIAGSILSIGLQREAKRPAVGAEKSGGALGAA